MAASKRLALLVGIGVSAVSISSLSYVPAAYARSASCDGFLSSQREVEGHLVGPTDCEIVRSGTVEDDRGRPVRRLDLAVSGTTFGYVVPEGSRAEVTDVGPELAFPQRGDTDAWRPAVAEYDGGTGTGMQILYPDGDAGTPWNGKIIMINHGKSQNTRLGELVPRHKNTKFDPLTGGNFYAGLMIDKGFAVVHTTRPASDNGGVRATLEDGTVLTNRNLRHNAGMMFDFLAMAKNVIEPALGRQSQAVYWYGHSAGASLARAINYTGANVGPDGERLIDGFLLDDAGGGLPLPVVMPPGEVLGWDGEHITFDEDFDTLLEDEQSRAAFTKTIEITHQAYLNEHDFLPGPTYTDIKRENARLMLEKGLGDKHRMYEIAGVSHIEAGDGYDGNHQPETNLDIGGVMAAVIDVLDVWVDDAVMPPPSKSDLPLLGDADHDGVVENPAVTLPRVACPAGVFFAFPPPDGPASRTGLAAFDGESLEPVDSRGVHLDVNGNGVRDTMETTEEAWQRLGLLRDGRHLTRGRYSRCVAQSANELVRERLLPPRVAGYYKSQAHETFPGGV